MPHRAPSITQRQKDSQDLRARALVAAHYEDCFQASSQLYDTLEANRPDSDDLFKLAQECKNRLRWWAEDTGASSRLLDYALKDSPALALQTKGLLKDLSEVITQGMRACVSASRRMLVSLSSNSLQPSLRRLFNILRATTTTRLCRQTNP